MKRGIVYRMNLDQGVRLFVDVPPDVEVSRILERFGGDTLTVVDPRAETPTVKLFTRQGERVPALDDLDYAFWYLYRMGLATIEEEPLARALLTAQTALGMVHFELPLYMTGNHLQISLPGESPVVSKCFDQHFLSIDPSGRNLLIQLGRSDER